MMSFHTMAIEEFRSMDSVVFLSVYSGAREVLQYRLNAK